MYSLKKIRDTNKKKLSKVIINDDITLKFNEKFLIKIKKKVIKVLLVLSTLEWITGLIWDKQKDVKTGTAKRDKESTDSRLKYHTILTRITYNFSCIRDSKHRNNFHVWLALDSDYKEHYCIIFFFLNLLCVRLYTIKTLLVINSY